MLPPGLQTPREVVLYYDARYSELVESGKAVPFLYPWAAIGATLAFGYLLIDHRRSRYLAWLRFPIFILLAAFSVWCILTNRARNPAAGFGIGLISSFVTLWYFSVLVVNDCQMDFKRIERASLNETSGTKHEVDDPSANSTAKSSALDVDLQPGKSSQSSSRTMSTSYQPQALVWQSYPSSSSIARLSWVLDLFCSIRGVGWTFQTSGIPPPPIWVEEQLKGQAKPDCAGNGEVATRSKTGIRRYHDRPTLIKHTWQNLILGYFMLDLIKTLMHHDPYFWGYIDAPGPDYLPHSVLGSCILLKSYRLLISLAGIYVALVEIFKLGPLFFCGLLGPTWIGVRGEAWMNPADMYGSFSSVWDKGLAGWWGGWWHQTFRFAFEAPATRLLELCGVEKNSRPGRAVSLFVAFFLSGCLHACGSFTQLGDTRPLMGPMRFFLLQAVGILVQSELVAQLKIAGIWGTVPKLFRQIANLVLVHVWLFFTAPLLLDDFARGGVWLYEPIAISPLRGLGFGQADDGWWSWWYGPIWWHTGKHWYETGIAF